MISLALATGILHLLAAPRSVEIVFIAISTFVLRCFGPANYGILVAGITGYIVFAFAIAGVPPGPVIAARGLNTLAGGLIAMLAYWLWPTWERTQVSVALAGMLDAYRAYFRAVTECYGNPDTRSPVQLDRTRLDARLARSNLEASVARMTAEPGTPSPGLMVMSAILANSHRLIHRHDVARGWFDPSSPAPARAATRAFAKDVDLTFVLSVRCTPRLQDRHRRSSRPARRPSRASRIRGFARRALRAGQRRNRPHHQQPEHSRARGPGMGGGSAPTSSASGCIGVHATR